MNAFLSNIPKRVLRPFQYNFALLIAVYQKTLYGEGHM